VISENSPAVDVPSLRPPLRDVAQKYIEVAIDDVISSLPDPARLSHDQRRGIIARYTAVLEPNFIYWMAATYLSARSAEAHEIIKDNLREEVRDNHPGMLYRFARAARATATDTDRIAIDMGVHAVRTFVARMDPLQIIPMMAFFEGFIQRFMPYLAELAAQQGSGEREYTDVHNVGDVAHTLGLLNAFSAELRLVSEPAFRPSVFEGIVVLRSLVEAIVRS
jgi:hypothetical protein